MGWFDGVAADANLFRRSVDGRRVYSPGLIGPWYLVSDDAASRIQHDVRILFRWGMPVAIAVLSLGARVWGWRIAAAGVIVLTFAFQRWVTRGLPRTPVRRSELIRVDHRARYLAIARATGRRALERRLAFASVAALLGCAGAVVLHEPSGWLLSAMMLAVAAFDAWQLHLLRADAPDTQVQG